MLICSLCAHWYVHVHLLDQGQACYQGESAFLFVVNAFFFFFKPYLSPFSLCGYVYHQTSKLTFVRGCLHVGSCLCQGTFLLPLRCTHCYKCCVDGVGGETVGISPRANRQSAGVSVNSVISWALHTFGISSPFIKHETALKGGNLSGVMVVGRDTQMTHSVFNRAPLKTSCKLS